MDSASEKAKMNKMGTDSVSRLLLSMGIPMIISMAIQALYNIVDSYFVSHMGDEFFGGNISGYSVSAAKIGDYATNALQLAFPMQMLMVAIGVGTGVGVNALLSRSLGEGNRKKAGKIAGNSIFLGLCTFAVFFIFGLFGVPAYISTQTNDAVITDMVVEYLRICCIWSLGISLYMIYEKLLQSTGRTVLSTIAQISGTVVNMILDPILIFGWLGFPSMGISGAAYATVAGQFVSFILDAIFHYIFNKRDFDTDFSYIKPSAEIIKEIYKVGIPAILMQALMSFMSYGINIIFGLVSPEAVNAYGIYYKIQQFVFFAAFGMNNAIIPLVAFNYGKNDYKRVNDGIKYGVIYTVIIMTVGLGILQIAAEPVAGIFNVSDKTRELTVLSMHIVTVGYIFVGANIAYQGIFQALGKGIASLILSLLRLIVICLPTALLFTFSPNAEQAIWWSFPIAELGALIYAVLYMINLRKTCISKLKKSNENICKIDKAINAET